jgi:N-acetylneuraminic acid mutarotase
MLNSLTTCLTLAGVFSTVAGSCLPCKPGTWQDLAPIPLSARQEHTTVALSSSTIAILGGIIPDEEALALTTDIMQLYDISADTWTSAASMPLPLNHANAAVVDGKLYLLGGLAVDTDGAWRAVPDSWVYYPDEDRWESIVPMPNGTERGSAAMGVHGSTIYLAGGMTILDVPNGGYQNSITTVLAYDTVRGTWTTFSEQLPEGRDHAGGAVVGSTLYVLGGRHFGQENVRDTVFTLDLDDSHAEWQTSSARMPTARGGVAAATVGPRVFIFGGEGSTVEGSNGVFDQTEVFDTITESWEELPPMKLPRHGTSAVAVNGRVYIPGGGIVQSAGPVNTTDVFCPGYY